MADVVNLTDVKLSLNLTRDTDDDELQDVLDDAIQAVEDVIGPLGSQTVVEQFDNHGHAIVLSKTPVIGIDSVSIEPWLGAAAIDDTAAWVVNTNTGVLRRNLVGGSMPYYGRGSVFTITYTAGRADVPGPVNRAILMQVADMWSSQRGAMPLPAGGSDDAAPFYPGASGFLGPQVMELLRPYLPPPGLA